jgi:hypothetical protein
VLNSRPKWQRRQMNLDEDIILVSRNNKGVLDTEAAASE